MRSDLSNSDILSFCQPLNNQLSWRFVALKYLYQPSREDGRPLSLSGSLKGGGRFNVSRDLARANPDLTSFGAIYTSTKTATALAEMRFPNAEETPYLLFPIRSTLARCLDLRDAEVAEGLGVNLENLKGDWREQSKLGLSPAYPQKVATRLNAVLVEGILTESVTGTGTNLTLYPHNLRGKSVVSVSASAEDPSVRDVWLPPETS